MNKLFEQGLKISQNLIFKRMTKRATKLVAMPVKLGMLLVTAYGVLSKQSEGAVGFASVKESMNGFIRMVKAYMNGGYRGVSAKSVILTVGVLIYLVSPLDLVPDFIPGLGFMDDLSLITWLVATLKDELTKFESWELGQNFETAGTGHS